MKSVVISWGISNEKITPIHSALHPIDVNETKDEIRKMFNYKGTVLVTAARFVSWKGIGTLISLIPTLKEELDEVTLVIVGNGPLEQDLKKKARELGLNDTVRFVGRLPKSSLGTTIKGADVFVLNTSYEGMSHQLLEAMDLGVPIVTTHVGGNPELITDGVNGLLVPYDNKEELVSAITRVATHDTFRNQIVQHARLRVKDFSENIVIEELISILNSKT